MCIALSLMCITFSLTYWFVYCILLGFLNAQQIHTLFFHQSPYCYPFHPSPNPLTLYVIIFMSCGSYSPLSLPLFCPYPPLSWAFPLSSLGLLLPSPQLLCELPYPGCFLLLTFSFTYLLLYHPICFLFFMTSALTFLFTVRYLLLLCGVYPFLWLAVGFVYAGPLSRPSEVCPLSFTCFLHHLVREYTLRKVVVAIFLLIGLTTWGIVPLGGCG